jgi:translocation and assembly module TamA
MAAVSGLPRYLKRPAAAPVALLLIALTVARAAGSAEVVPLARFEVPAPTAAELDPLMARILEALRSGERLSPDDAEDDEAALRRLRQQATDVLATEGYFTPHLAVAADPQKQARYRIAVDAGPRTSVERVDLVLRGAIETDPERLAELRQSWDLSAGRPFRDKDWSNAKSRLLARVVERDFPAARMVESHAQIDPRSASAVLGVTIDSGPQFSFGPLRITGLRRYDPTLVQRFNEIQIGEPYSASRLQDLQRRLQACGYFSSVVADIDLDPDTARRAPIQIQLTEAKTQSVALGLGYSSNVGPRAEANYRQALIFGAPYTWQSGVGFDTTRSVGYTDLYFPPHPNGSVDSLGLLAEHTDINDVQTRRWAAGVARSLKRQVGATDYDTRVDLNFQHELRTVTGAILPASTIDVVSSTVTWTRRRVDQVTDPTRGDLLTLSGTAGLHTTLLSNLANATLWRGYVRYVRYIPLSSAYQWIVRGEAGYLVADTLDQVPSEFLFRAGGVGSIRGFSYLSLGQQVGSATLGSRSLVTASNELVHWFGPRWGAAAFYDTGNAGNPVQLAHLARGYGLGARWRTPAGPLALDVAYGDRTIDGQGGRWRLHFSVAIAF